MQKLQPHLAGLWLIPENKTFLKTKNKLKKMTLESVVFQLQELPGVEIRVSATLEGRSPLYRTTYVVINGPSGERIGAGNGGMRYDADKGRFFDTLSSLFTSENRPEPDVSFEVQERFRFAMSAIYTDLVRNGHIHINEAVR